VLLPPSGDELRWGDHIPGSDILFETTKRLVLHKSAIVPGDRSPASSDERSPAVWVRLVGDFMAGDVAAWYDESADHPRIGRPMQIREVGPGWGTALDDLSLQGPRGIPSAALSILRSPAGLWHLLDMWWIVRCPRCRAPGVPSQSGCMVPLRGTGDASCPGCDASWDVSHLLAHMQDDRPEGQSEPMKIQPPRGRQVGRERSLPAKAIPRLRG
jgi:hypothetical protein